jgi:hypothetical protein
VRKVNVLEFVSLDGVIQAPGGPEEDTSGGFGYGGWTSPHADSLDGTIPAAFKVTESTVTSKGVIIVNYERAGAVPIGRL